MISSIFTIFFFWQAFDLVATDLLKANKMGLLCHEQHHLKLN